jgi:ligand-binding sensor domain-containing protein
VPFLLFFWAATMNGVVRWNRHDGTYKTYTTADGLAGNQVWSVAVDQAGNKWFA